MDNIIKEPQVTDVLIFKVLKKDLCKKTKMREAYRQHFLRGPPMRMLKVHQVHEYTYTALSEGEGQRVELAYHGGIDTPKYSTKETFTTTENRYVKWKRDTDFEPTHWDMKGLHICRPTKQVLDSGKHGPETVRKKEKEHAKVSAFQQDIIKFAN